MDETLFYLVLLVLLLLYSAHKPAQVSQQGLMEQVGCALFQNSFSVVEIE